MSKIVNIVFAVFVVISLFFLGYRLLGKDSKVGFITTMKVFDAFRFKKELEKKYQTVQIAKQGYLDSLRLCIEFMEKPEGKQLNEANVNELKKVYLLKERQYNEENEALYKDYTERIWKQLNQYVEDYGKENHYKYILGANGQGNIMYADPAEDLTEKVIQYINARYEGKQK